MEPPKKRKYTGLDNEGNDRVNVKEEPSSVLVDENYGEQHAVVSSEGGGGLPAKRNRRSYSLEFKVAVLDSFYNDTETRLNQRKTAIKYGVNRRQIQKWLAQEETLRGSVGAGYTQSHSLGQVPGQTPTASLPSPPSSKEDATSPLSTYLSYQSKIDYLRRGEVGPLTVLEVKGEASEEEELANYVIDEGVEEDDDDDRPINLSKSCSDKRPEKDSRQVDRYESWRFRTSAGGQWQCHGWLGLACRSAHVRSIASSFKPILGPSSSSGLSLPARVFSLTVGNARAHGRGRFSPDQPTTGRWSGRAGEESTPCTNSTTTAQNYRLSLELSRPGFNKQERERGAPSGRQRALWRTSRANQPTVRAFATFRLSNNICSLLMWRSA